MRCRNKAVCSPQFFSRPADVALGIALAYLLTSTVFQPIFGRGTDLFGSRSMLFLSIIVFDIGSLFCAVATNYIWFCCGRAIAGESGVLSLSLVY